MFFGSMPCFVLPQLRRSSSGLREGSSGWHHPTRRRVHVDGARRERADGHVSADRVDVRVWQLLIAHQSAAFYSNC